ncbi:hypothetical protein BJX68DRAFT_258694 [Aspergillus pseudodeflectus]|uniref:Uncharacterized protein n=1 Tax=Aspergillus pseudodeflectus TaxID=176178 RepID=A0ABR4JIN0_9EURO
MASNANPRGYHMPVSQMTPLEAFRSILKGVTPDSTQQQDDFRISEPSHNDNVREIFAEGSDCGLDCIEVNSLDVSSLLEEVDEYVISLSPSRGLWNTRD